MVRHNRLVKHFIRDHRPHVQDEREFYAGSKSLREAIDRATRSLRADGTKHSHQWRRRWETLEEARDELQAIRSALSKAKTFDALYTLVADAVIPIHDISELTAYDFAWRIGVFLELEPEVVYLHRGTRDGAVALGFSRSRKSLAVEELPAPLRALTPAEIEDYLCIFKDDFVGEAGKRQHCFTHCSNSCSTGRRRGIC